LPAQISRFALGLQQLNGDIVEGSASVGARDMGEAAAGVRNLAVGHYQAGLGLAGHGVDDVGGAEADVNVRQVVPMEKRSVVGGDADAENASIGIFKHEMMVRLVRNRDRDRRLGAEGKCE
jgi:hypothetical protein